MKDSVIRFLYWYKLKLEKKPLLTKMITAATTAMIGDLLCQSI